MRHSLEQKLKLFDFTVGDEPYKRDWCDIEIALYDYLSAVSVRGWAFVGMLAAYRRFKRFIKQSPRLMHTLSKLRAGLASRGSRAARSGSRS
jgi:CelD/BcsL family acetyltransferase involved in cellulose biosynthesis